MRNIKIISKFTFLEAVKKKSFLITFSLTLLLIVLGFNIPNIISLFDKAEPNKIILVDKDNVFQEYVKDNPKFEVKQKVDNYDVDELDNIDAIVEFKKGTFDLYLKENKTAEISSYIDYYYFNELYKRIKMEEILTDKENISYINEDIKVNIVQAETEKDEMLMGIGVIVTVVLFYLITFTASLLSSVITIEKTSKIIDSLIISASPREIILGKSLGIFILALLEMIAITIVSFLSYKLFLPKGIIDNLLDISSINMNFVLIIIAFFIFGYIIYSFLYALAGSFVSKIEDATQVNGFVSMILFISYYISIVVMTLPSSPKFAAYIPFTAPFYTPSAYMTNIMSLNEVLLSIIILIISSVIVGYLSIKVYQNAILNYGIKFSFKNVLKMFKTK